MSNVGGRTVETCGYRQEGLRCQGRDECPPLPPRNVVNKKAVPRAGRESEGDAQSFLLHQNKGMCTHTIHILQKIHISTEVLMKQDDEETEMERKRSDYNKIPPLMHLGRSHL